MIRIALIVVLLLGCKVKNELSCEDPANADLSHCSGVDAPEACSAADPCSSGVCKLPDGVCVDCIEDTDCPVDAPVCNASNECERCDAHTDCTLSNVCDTSTGMCVAETDVAYVVEGGGGATADGCERSLPCDDITNAIGTTKPFIKFDTTTMVDVVAEQQIGRDVTIFAEPGARLRRTTTTGPIIQIVSNSTVGIFDLEIREGAGTSGHAIEIVSDDVNLTLERVLLVDNAGRGVEASSMATKLVMRRCVVSANTGGGMSLQDVGFDISNSLFVRNGAGGSTVGGVRVTGQDAMSVFRFNTVADNVSGDAATSGVNCDTGFTANNNIVASNGLDTTCTFNHSMFNGTVPGGTGNISGVPDFAETNVNNARAANYYRLTATSDAIDKADPAATEAIDIDGQARPMGTADIGADELNP